MQNYKKNIISLCVNMLFMISVDDKFEIQINFEMELALARTKNATNNFKS